MILVWLLEWSAYMDENEKYLRLLSKDYPTIGRTTSEIINLEAIMNLPKATEHFVSDIHGEYEAFQHVLRNGSGNIKGKIDEVFADRLVQKEKNALAVLIYYPEEKTKLILSAYKDKEKKDEWYRVTLSRLLEVCVFVASKYTRSKVRKALPDEFAYIIEELLFKDTIYTNKNDYYNEISDTIISLDRGAAFITAISYLIQRLVVDHLHVVGDIYDRGPYPDKIIETLRHHHSVDIQWGNHDILWMGAASGSTVCMANVIRIQARYNNLSVLEDGYGISLRQLWNFADAVYSFKKESCFLPKTTKKEQQPLEEEIKQLTKIQQAAAIIQFKLEGPIIQRHPEFHLDHRLLLNKINYRKGTITLNGEEYPLTETDFPTIDPSDPYCLTTEEEAIVKKLIHSFKNSQVLQKHVSYLINHGSMYLTYNNNLLVHGCIPMNEDGSFMEMEIRGKMVSGKGLLTKFEDAVRKAYLYQNRRNNDNYLDLVWYLWTGPVSSLFGKDQMTTFERYYIADKKTHKEKKNKYYEKRNDPETCKNILAEFSLDPNKGYIINGHTPVKEKKGENPIKANGRLIVIDGGFSKAYQGTTGLAGYTLLYNSYGMILVSHQPFTSQKEAIEQENDIVSKRRVVEQEVERMKVKDTDIGKQLREKASDLRKLLHAYREGDISENTKVY